MVRSTIYQLGSIKFFLTIFRQNCALWQSKFLRRYYHRPTLLPPMIELTRPNWILISSPNTSSKNVSKANSLKSITPSARTDLIAIIQIHGSIGLELQAFPPTTPSPPSLSLDCQKRCKNLSSIVVEENNLGENEFALDFIKRFQKESKTKNLIFYF